MPFELPLCSLRGPEDGGLYPCASRWLYVTGDGVPAEVCQVCPYPNKQGGPGQVNRSAACRYRGDTLRTVLCPTCAGTVKVKVFACLLHGECTISKPVGPPTCQLCPSYANDSNG